MLFRSALDFHPNEWRRMFVDVGLTGGDADLLRSMILEDVSTEWRRLMNTLEPIQDDVVVTVLDSDGEERSVLAWEAALRDLNITYD